MSDLRVPYDIKTDAECRVEWVNKRVRLNELQKEYVAFEIKEAVEHALSQANGVGKSTEQALHKHIVMPRISHFIDENGNNVDLNAEGVNVKLKRDGTLEYYRSFGFAGRKELTPVYGA